MVLSAVNSQQGFVAKAETLLEVIYQYLTEYRTWATFMFVAREGSRRHEELAQLTKRIIDGTLLSLRAGMPGWRTYRSALIRHCWRPRFVGARPVAAALSGSAFPAMSPTNLHPCYTSSVVGSRRDRVQDGIAQTAECVRPEFGHARWNSEGIAP
jgi:hypothetical protein